MTAKIIQLRYFKRREENEADLVRLAKEVMGLIDTAPCGDASGSAELYLSRSRPRMTEAVFDFKAIRQKLERQDQKAEFEEKNPKVEPSMYGLPYGVACPLKSLAHPEWPYAGSPHEWPKFKI